MIVREERGAYQPQYFGIYAQWLSSEEEVIQMAEVTKKRWTSRASFIFAATGSAIDLGNIWRFPYMTCEYGGATF